MKPGMGSHQSPKMEKDEWLTPPEILKELGPFDLDPCHPVNAPWFFALDYFTVEDDGLKHDWYGRVWCNPPYGVHTENWLKKLADHGRGTALIFARTETAMFFSQVWNRATALLFLKGRLHFHHVSGERAALNAGAPSVLIAYGEYDAERLEKSKIHGKFLRLR
jgi:hypothetical protein